MSIIAMVMAVVAVADGGTHAQLRFTTARIELLVF